MKIPVFMDHKRWSAGGCSWNCSLLLKIRSKKKRVQDIMLNKTSSRHKNWKQETFLLTHSLQALSAHTVSPILLSSVCLLLCLLLSPLSDLFFFHFFPFSYCLLYFKAQLVSSSTTDKLLNHSHLFNSIISVWSQVIEIIEILVGFRKMFFHEMVRWTVAPCKLLNSLLPVLLLCMSSVLM